MELWNVKQVLYLLASTFVEAFEAGVVDNVGLVDDKLYTICQMLIELLASG